jgi:pyruvate dehydrogenase E1 component alpha subunit
MGMASGKVTNLIKLSDRARGYNIDGYTVEGNDAVEVYSKTLDITKSVRKNHKPVILEAVTYRIRGHSLRDAQRYRAKGEAKEWMIKYCPINRFKKYLLDAKKSTTKTIENIEKKVDQNIKEAVKFALKSPLPDPLKLMEDIYA